MATPTSTIFSRMARSIRPLTTASTVATWTAGPVSSAVSPQLDAEVAAGVVHGDAIAGQPQPGVGLHDRVMVHNPGGDVTVELQDDTALLTGTDGLDRRMWR